MPQGEQTPSVTVLGSGTSTGVPVIGCDCHICQSPEPRHQRLRSSIFLRHPDFGDLVIDTTPDFRQQMLRQGIKHLDGVLYTHTHADHCHGFDDLRAFSFYRDDPIRCYGHSDDLDEIRMRFAYAFEDTSYQGTKPSVDLIPWQRGQNQLGQGTVELIRLPHGGPQTSGYRFGSFAYVTDFKKFTPEQVQAWKGKVKTMIVSGVKFGEHPTHSTIEESIDLLEQLQVERGYLTHLSHEVDDQRDQGRLPEHVQFAFDGLTVPLEL